jgi:hypothetical protein
MRLGQTPSASDRSWSDQPNRVLTRSRRATPLGAAGACGRLFEPARAGVGSPRATNGRCPDGQGVQYRQHVEGLLVQARSCWEPRSSASAPPSVCAPRSVRPDERHFKISATWTTSSRQHAAYRPPFGPTLFAAVISRWHVSPPDPSGLPSLILSGPSKTAKTLLGLGGCLVFGLNPARHIRSVNGQRALPVDGQRFCPLVANRTAR